MKCVFADNAAHREAIITFTDNFETGKILVRGTRNTISLFQLDGRTIAIKSFRIPNIFNALVYRFFRKSKARRSFEFGKKLIASGIKTPDPLAYIEKYAAGLLQESYYVSDYIEPDLTFKDLVSNPDFPDHENILRQFTRFCFDLHQKKIEFLDHTPGNTLIKQLSDGKYEFYLVDLNRMKFNREMPIDERMKNLSRLTPKIEMVRVMANEYSKLANLSEKKVFESLWNQTQSFQSAFHRKKKLKRNLKFLKKSAPILFLCL